MKVKWNQISSSDQVYFAQDPTGSVPENSCLMSKGELIPVCLRETVLVQLSGQIDKSLFLWYLWMKSSQQGCWEMLTVNCNPTVQLELPPTANLAWTLKPSHLFLMLLSDGMIWFLLYCSSSKNLLCTKNMKIKLYLAYSKKNFASNSNNSAVVPISQLYHADFWATVFPCSLQLLLPM